MPYALKTAIRTILWPILDLYEFRSTLIVFEVYQNTSNTEIYHLMKPILKRGIFPNFS